MKNFKFCKEDIQTFQPDAVILINYSAFNLRMAKWTHQKNTKPFFIFHRRYGHGKKAGLKQLRSMLIK